MSHPYQYAVLRFVPRVDRGECLNVGVVVHSQSAGVLRCAFHLDEPRIVAFAPDADLDGLRRSRARADLHLEHTAREVDGRHTSNGR